MKASLITLSTIHNYGSVLQAYASGRFLQNYFDEVELVDYVSINGRKKETLSSAWQRHGYNRFSLKKLLYTLIWQLDWMKKDRVFGGFIRKHFPFSRRFKSQAEINADPPKADVYFSGSDMLWSSVLNQGHEERQFYLDFAPAGKKRIALSACIGEDNIDQDERTFLKPLLSKYDSISMREESGTAILSSMEIEATTLLDPTLLLEPNEWITIARKPQMNNYILVYFLHEHSSVLSEAHAYARNHGYRLLRISFNPKKLLDDDVIAYMPAIEDFLGLFSCADAILTDSFHGVAFSLIFHRQFNVVAPPRFVSRIDNILEITDTKNRAIRDKYSPMENIINFDFADKAIASYRDKAKTFMKKAI